MRRFVALVVAMLIVAGCGSTSPSAQASAAASAQAGQVNVVCGSIRDLQVSVGVLRSLDPKTASQETYQAAVDGVIGTAKATVENIKLLAKANANLVSTTWDALDQAIQAQSSEAPLPSVVAAVQPEAQQFSDALTAVNQELDCPGQ
jgi:regulator of protease activity HflC (stomatin/prohibitin superfamily)